MGILQLQHFPLGFSSAFSEQLGSSDLPVQPLVSSGSIHLPANGLKLFKGSNLYRGNHIRLKAPTGSRSSYNRVGQVGKISAIMGSPVSVKGRGELRVFDNGDDLKASLADFVAALSESAVKERGAFSVVLSGGSLINALRKLTEPPYLNGVDWARWHVFWADERVVAKSHPDSNYKLANDNFLSKVPIVPGHVYSINDSLPVEAAAKDYETGLRQLVKAQIIDLSRSNDHPKFDLILLGMGPDGHIASLFPDHPLLNEKEKWITFITDSPKPPAERITFTLPVINSAANIVVVVTGSGKAETLRKVLGEEPQHDLLPAQKISPTDGKLTWFADKEAVSLLDSLEIVPTGSISNVEHKTYPCSDHFSF